MCVIKIQDTKTNQKFDNNMIFENIEKITTGIKRC